MEIKAEYPADALRGCPHLVVSHNHDSDNVVLVPLQCEVWLVHLCQDVVIK